MMLDILLNITFSAIIDTMVNITNTVNTTNTINITVLSDDDQPSDDQPWMSRDDS